MSTPLGAQVETGSLDAARVTAVVPVKALPQAKSRLGLPPQERRALALAFALDTIAAVEASALVGGVLVVTADAEVAERLRHRPVQVEHDAGGGLEGAVAAGLAAAARWRPEAGVVVVPGDLPCLRPEDVDEVVRRAGEGAFVPDRSATGTTLLVLPAGRVLTTRYGPDSAAQHRGLGLQPLEDAPVRARHDVDTVADLDAAVALGVGPSTAAVLGVNGGVTPRWRPSPSG